MYKYHTQFTSFVFNPNPSNSIYQVTWYVLQYGENGYEMGRCFTQSELTLFSSFVAQNPLNFPGDKQYSECNENEAVPVCGGTIGLIPRPKLTVPHNFVLKKEPYRSTTHTVFNCMDAVLLPNHTYNLEFDVVGRIDSVN